MKHITRYFSSKAWAPPLGWTKGVGRGQNSTFSEYGHVPNQIKGNDACSNTVAYILPVDP